MKVGLIGAGRIGTRHASTLATLPDVDIAISDAVAESAHERTNSAPDASFTDLDGPPPTTTVDTRTSVSQTHANRPRDEKGTALMEKIR